MTKAEALTKLEQIVNYCIPKHGGFRHSNHVGFCPSCAAQVLEVFDSRDAVICEVVDAIKNKIQERDALGLKP